MEMELTQEVWLYIAVFTGVIIGMVLTPKNILKELFALSKINVDMNTTIQSLSILNKELELKTSQVENLNLSIHELEEVHMELVERIDFMKTNDDLVKLDELKEASKKFEKLQETIKRLQGKNESKFNMASLINMIQSLYFDLYNQELSIKEVSNLMNSGFASTGSFGGMNMNQTKSTRKPMM